MKSFNQLPVKFLAALCFSVAFILSSNAFAAKPAQGFLIGDIGPGGGIVFHVTDNGLHGLEAAPDDQSVSTHWGQITTTNAVKSGFNDGSFNTDRIIITNGHDFAPYAALVAANYNGGGYGNWYLPSKDELNLMYTKLHSAGLGGFAADGYWSSTEYDINDAWHLNFSNGNLYNHYKAVFVRVRAVRSF